MRINPYYARLTFLAFLVLLLASCMPTSTRTTTSPPPVSHSSGPQSLLDSAEQAYSQGQYQAALDYFKKYLAQEPNPPRLESVLAGYGLAAEKAGQYQEALAAYNRLIREFPTGDFGREAKPRIAAIYLTTGDATRAEGLAKQILAEEKDAGRQLRPRLILGQSQWLQNNYAAAAGNFLTVWRSSGGQIKSEAEEGVKASLARMSAPELDAVQKQYGQNFPGPEAAYLLVRKAVESGNSAEAMSRADYFGRYFSDSPLMPDVTTMVQGGTVPALAFGRNYDPRKAAVSAMTDIAQPVSSGTQAANLSTVGDVTVAVILPMSGDNASRFAQEVAKGLKLAVTTVGNGRIGLNVMDTRGQPAEAARLVGQAASDPKVVAVVGPFLSRESAQAAQAAEKAGLPLIAVSQRTDLTKVGPNIFRIFLTPKHQAEAVARYTVQVQGHQALGVLYPDDNYGRPMRTYFENEARRLGAQVTVADSYDPKAGNWDEAVNRITGGKVARKVSSNYQVDTGFTSLYMPDSAGPVSQILPLMAFHDVTRMQYLGSPLWLSQDLLANVSRYVQGAVIPVAMSELSQREETRRFIGGYQNTYGGAPDQFAAYGYDAGLAIISALSRGGGNRAGLRQALSQMGPVAGATGPFNFDSSGEYAVEPTLLSVKDKSFILLREPGPAPH